MFSLELRNLTAPPPGIPISFSEASYLFSSLKMDEIEKIDEEFYYSKQKYRNCEECKNLLRLCEDIFKQKVRAMACLAETFHLLQQEINAKESKTEYLFTEQDQLDDIEILPSQNKSFAAELKKKNSEIQELLAENKELNVNRIYTQKILNQMILEIEKKNSTIQTLEKIVSEKSNTPDCNFCIQKDLEIKSKSDAIKESTLQIQILTMKLAENIKILSENSGNTEKIELIGEMLNKIPEINGRELRISIHKQICEIETDFIELSPNQENFEIIKMKYLQLPYLLKPIFDLTKTYEKSVAGFKKILFP